MQNKQPELQNMERTIFQIMLDEFEGQVKYLAQLGVGFKAGYNLSKHITKSINDDVVWSVDKPLKFF